MVGRSVAGKKRSEMLLKSYGPCSMLGKIAASFCSPRSRRRGPLGVEKMGRRQARNVLWK